MYYYYYLDKAFEGKVAQSMSTTDATCDLSDGIVNVSSGTLENCNGPQPTNDVNSLRIFGIAKDSNTGITVSMSSLTIFLADVTAESAAPLTIQGSTVLVILEGSNHLVSIAGRGVDCSSSNVTLSSLNSGTLKAEGPGDWDGVGIGVGDGDSCETLSFVNVSVSAFGYTGIGTAQAQRSPGSRIKNLTIENSSLSEIGSAGGCGLGAGVSAGEISRIDEIRIWNSTVVSPAGDGPGIGTSYSDGPGSTSYVGLLSISYSRISATNTYWGAAIGTGSSNRGGLSEINGFTILNSTVFARGGENGAGIGTGTMSGTGEESESRSSIGFLLIAESHIHASSTYHGAGIGSAGGEMGGISEIDSLAILNSTVFARGGEHGAGIGTGTMSGTGEESESRSSIGFLLIAESHVHASTTDLGAGIGTGFSQGLVMEIDNITIINSTVVAQGADGGSGIGTGVVQDLQQAVIGTIVISNSRLTATIGSGSSGGEVGCVKFIGNCFVECQGSEGPPDIRASSILIATASLAIVTDRTPLFDTTPVTSGCVDLTIGYHRKTVNGSELLPSVNGAFFHIGDVNVPDDYLGSLRFGVHSADLSSMGIRYWFDETVAPIRSVVLTARTGDSLSFFASNGNASSHLMASDGTIRFFVESTYSFIEILSFPPSGTTCDSARSAPLRNTVFAMFGEGQTFIATTASCKSEIFIGSPRKSASDQFSISVVVSFSSCTRLSDSTILLRQSMSSSDRALHQTGGAEATRITLVAIASFILLAIAAVVVVVAFRRQTKLLTDTEVAPSDSGAVMTPDQDAGNGLISIAPNCLQSLSSPTSNPHSPTESLTMHNPVIESHHLVGQQNELNNKWQSFAPDEQE
jgi:hypothetical protein